MKRLIQILVGTLIFVSGILPVKAQSIDPCTANKLVEEIRAYLLLQHQPDFSGYSLQDAVTLGNGDDLWISTKIVDFDMAFGTVMKGEEDGLPYKLSRYFTGGNGRQEFIETLKAAGYVQGRISGPTFWGSYQNVWYKKEGWKDPCSGGGGSGGSMVPEATVHYAWYMWVLFILALVAAGIIILRVIPI